MKLILGGAMGRMGEQMRIAAEKGSIEILCGVDLVDGKGLPFPCYSEFSKIECDVSDAVIVDFSKPSALEGLLAYAVSRHIPCILCATGYTDEMLGMIMEASEKIPILRSANMSLGVCVMQELCAMAGKILNDFDVEIVEKHHCMKQDAPSGTAKMLYEAVASARGNSCAVEGRAGANCPRHKGDIGIAAVRGGTVTGVHEVGFYGSGEELLITHVAENRSLFAQGALTAACWVAGRENGLYSMRDVIREKLGGNEL